MLKIKSVLLKNDVVLSDDLLKYYQTLKKGEKISVFNYYNKYTEKYANEIYLDYENNTKSMRLYVKEDGKELLYNYNIEEKETILYIVESINEIRKELERK